VARRGENIYKRKDGRWEGRCVVGKHDDGRSIYKYIYGSKYSNVKQSLIALKATTAKQNCHIGVFAGHTFNVWAQHWLYKLSKPNVKPSTFSSYHGHMKRHILPRLSHIKLIEITSFEIQDFVTDLSRAELSPATIQNIFRVLSACMKAARRFKEIPSNPCDDVITPSVRYEKVEVLSRDEQKRLERKSREFDENTHTAIMLSLYAGLRIGEVCALRWEDIDFDRNLININHTIQRITTFEQTGNKTMMIMDKPKSTNSSRQVPMPQAISDLLRRIRRSNGYVLCENNSYLDNRTLQYRFKSALRRANVRDVNFHNLRHTFATRCVECGIDVKILSEILGHATVKLTLDRYVHPLMEQKQEAMRSLKRA